MFAIALAAPCSWSTWHPPRLSVTACPPGAGSVTEDTETDHSRPEKLARTTTGGSGGALSGSAAMPSQDLVSVPSGVADSRSAPHEENSGSPSRFFADNDTAPLLWMEQVRTSPTLCSAVAQPPALRGVPRPSVATSLMHHTIDALCIAICSWWHCRWRTCSPPCVLDVSCC